MGVIRAGDMQFKEQHVASGQAFLTFRPKDGIQQNDTESESSDVEDVVRPPESFVKEGEEEKPLDDESSESSGSDMQDASDERREKTQKRDAGKEHQHANVKEGDQTSFPYIDRQKEEAASMTLKKIKEKEKTKS